MAKVFANVCFWDVCDILNAVLHFARDVRQFAFYAIVQFLDLCVNFWNVFFFFICVRNWKNCDKYNAINIILFVFVNSMTKGVPYTLNSRYTENCNMNSRY